MSMEEEEKGSKLEAILTAILILLALYMSYIVFSSLYNLNKKIQSRDSMRDYISCSKVLPASECYRGILSN